MLFLLLGDSLPYIAGVLLAVVIVVIVIAMVLFVLAGVGLKTLVEREGLSNSWMAFVPPLNLYLMGKLGEKQSKQSWKFLLKFLYPGLMICYVVFSVVPIINLIVPLAFFVVSMYVFFLIYERYSNHPVLFLVMTLLSGTLLYAVIIFSIRNSVFLQKEDVLRMKSME